MDQAARKIHKLGVPNERANKKAYIDDTCGHLKEDPCLIAFTKLYLDSMSLRRLQSFTHTELAEFVEKRYEYTLDALKNDGGYQAKEKVGMRTYIIEVAFPYTPQLLVTIERFLISKGAKIIFKIHPEIAIAGANGGAALDFERPTNENSRLSISYFEFDCSNLNVSLEEFKDDLDRHILAVKLSARDNSKNTTLLQEIKQTIIISENFQLDETKEEWANLVDWLLDSNFTVLGYTSFSDNIEAGTFPENGSGILAAEYLDRDPQLWSTLVAHTWKTSNHSSSMMFDNIRIKSPVQRKDYLMRLSLRSENENGTYEYRVILGLLRRSSGLMKNYSTPVIHLKMKEIFKTMGLTPGSYNYNEVARVFSTMPKFELFRTPTIMLQRMVDDMMSITDPNQIHCFAQEDIVYSRMQMVVYVPLDIYTPKVKKLITSHLKVNAPLLDAEVFEIRDAASYRIHIYFDLATESQWTPDLEKLENQISEMLKPWEEKILDLVDKNNAIGVERSLVSSILPMIPKHYRSRTSPEDTLEDIYYLEKLSKSSDIQYNLKLFEMPGSYLHNKASLLYIYSRDKIDLIDIMPILQNIGLYVLDQLTTRIGDEKYSLGYIQSFRVRNQQGDCIDLKTYKQKLGDLLSAIYGGKSENDPLNSLVLIANLEWRKISVLKLYRNLFIQAKGKFTRRKVNDALKKYPSQTLRLIKYFESKFSTQQEYGDKNYRIQQLLPTLKEDFFEGLRDVDEVASDVIFKRIFNLIECTLRTNFYIPKEIEKTFISIKLDSKKVEAIPIPAPHVEIYVHDVGLEGVHLRFGKVARGGLRWSDRHDDFRTEILGLVKTQQTKNVVIVPVGSKGGFTVKRLPEKREEALNAVQCEYKNFISGLLDITDNLDSSGKPVHPSYVIPYDGLDPYLVVAADKGTATFSDLANAISIEYNFWLGDAFASGGSYGYDHKKVGITARGGWECVKLHFKEMGKNIQTQPTTVVGIGDMGGDVFGNGMLQSKQLLLRAAFNHMHIFFDPDPDPAISWEERNRLFVLPRSTWKDYNPDKISAGGGVFDRKAKEVPLSPEIQYLLGVEKTFLSGEELVQCILKMKTDLLWFGGIGTYIKSDKESNLAVGDQANDDIRIDASQCQAKVIGEGANLGMTQLARRDLSHLNVHLNTDAIDNSAGVNMSDYEVNIKVLLQRFMNENLISDTKERNAILETATEEVSELVLANNRGQHRLISMDQLRVRTDFKKFRDLITELIQNRGLDGKSEGVPTIGELTTMEGQHKILSRPVIAVLQAYVKMWVYNSLLKSEIVTSPYLEKVYRNYFPTSIRERFKDNISQHPLKNEIIGTQVTNKIVNQAGINFFFDLHKELNADVGEISGLYLLVDESLEASSLRKIILKNAKAPEAEKYKLLIEFEDKIKEVVRYLLKSSKLYTLDSLPQFKELFECLKKACGQEKIDYLGPQPWDTWELNDEEMNQLKILSVLDFVPDIMLIQDQQDITVSDSLTIVRALKEKFEFEFLERMIQSLDVHDKWEAEHRRILLTHFSQHKSHLMNLLIDGICAEGCEDQNIEGVMQHLEVNFGSQLEEYFESIQGLQESSEINATNLTVVIEKLNFLNGSPK